MNIGLYESAASLSALERWQEAVAQNINSSEVTAYRKRATSVSAQNNGELLTDPRARVDRGEGEPAAFPVATSTISFMPGEAKPTGRELDLAIRGPGFFAVQTPDGTRAYTRTGEFRLRPDRTIVTGQGFPVLSAAGQPIQTLPGQGPVVIDQTGMVSQGTTQIARIALQDFANPGQLTPLSSGLYVAPEGVDPAAVAAPQILQGNLESSNLTSLREMVDLVTISRAYEANQKVITSRDDLFEKTLQAFG